MKDKRLLDTDSIKFDLARYYLDGFTEIVMKDQTRFYVYESPDTVRNIIVHYTVKNKDFKESYFNEAYTYEDGQKVYSHDLLVGVIDLNEIHYVTTEPICQTDINYLKKYLRLPSELNFNNIRKNMMVKQDVFNLKTLLKEIQSSLQVREEKFELT